MEWVFLLQYMYLGKAKVILQEKSIIIFFEGNKSSKLKGGKSHEWWGTLGALCIMSFDLNKFTFLLFSFLY